MEVEGGDGGGSGGWREMDGGEGGQGWGGGDEDGEGRRMRKKGVLPEFDGAGVVLEVGGEMWGGGAKVGSLAAMEAYFSQPRCSESFIL